MLITIVVTLKDQTRCQYSIATSMSRLLLGGHRKSKQGDHLLHVKKMQLSHSQKFSSLRPSDLKIPMKFLGRWI